MQCRCDELQARLSQLERGQRRLKRQAALLLIVALGAAPLGVRASGVASTVEARRFVLRDDKGKVRATLGAEQLGYGGIHGDEARTSTTSLTFFDSAGQKNAVLDASWDWGANDPAAFSSLWFRGRDSEQIRRGLTLGPAQIELEDANGRLTLGLNGDPATNAPNLDLRRQGVRNHTVSDMDGVRLGIRGLTLFGLDGNIAESPRQ